MLSKNEEEQLKQGLKYLEDDHVSKNSHRLGILGQQNIEFSINCVKDVLGYARIVKEDEK